MTHRTRTDDWWEDLPPTATSESEPLGPGFDAGDHRCVELCPICRGAELLRAGGSPDLRGQLDDLGREALLTLRALIDHYLERTERGPRDGGGVERIPIE